MRTRRELSLAARRRTVGAGISPSIELYASANVSGRDPRVRSTSSTPSVASQPCSCIEDLSWPIYSEIICAPRRLIASAGTYRSTEGGDTPLRVIAWRMWSSCRQRVILAEASARRFMVAADCIRRVARNERVGPCAVSTGAVCAPSRIGLGRRGVRSALSVPVRRCSIRLFDDAAGQFRSPTLRSRGEGWPRRTGRCPRALSSSSR